MRTSAYRIPLWPVKMFVSIIKLRNAHAVISVYVRNLISHVGTCLHCYLNHIQMAEFFFFLHYQFSYSATAAAAATTKSIKVYTM